MPPLLKSAISRRFCVSPLSKIWAYVDTPFESRITTAFTIKLFTSRNGHGCSAPHLIHPRARSAYSSCYGQSCFPVAIRVKNTFTFITVRTISCTITGIQRATFFLRGMVEYLLIAIHTIVSMGAECFCKTVRSARKVCSRAFRTRFSCSLSFAGFASYTLSLASYKQR